MSWAEIEIDENGRVTVRRGGTLTGEPEPMMEPEVELDPNPEPVTEPVTEPMTEPMTMPEPKPKLVTWRLCVRIHPWQISDLLFANKWYPSGDIPKHWYPIESYQQPIETVQLLPEGQKP